jgi:formate hydrogenlyase subunit 6/NADH:ubiquinone oxidoreductase subunit I
MDITIIGIDQRKCAEHTDSKPYECGKCLRICDPAVFLMYNTGDLLQDRDEPRFWKIKPLWLSMCTHCMKCVDRCPVDAITVRSW